MKNLKKEDYITKYEVKQKMINGNPAIRTIDAYKCLEDYKNDYVNGFIEFLSQRYKGINKDNIMFEKKYYEQQFEKSSALLDAISEEKPPQQLKQ